MILAFYCYCCCPHINCKINEKYISNRQIICSCLENFSKNKENCFYFNPLDYLQNKNAEDIFEKNKNGLNIGHYNKESLKIINNEIMKPSKVCIFILID